MTILSFRFINSVMFSHVVLTYRRLSFTIMVFSFSHDKGEDVDAFCGPIMNISL